MKPTTDLAVTKRIRERVRHLLRGRTVEGIIDRLDRGELTLAGLVEEIELFHRALMIQEAELHESLTLTDQALTRFVQLYRNLPVPAFMIAWDGALEDHNKAASETLAIDCRFFPQLAAPQDSRTLENALRQARDQGHATCREVALRSARYDILIVDLRLLLIPGLDGNTPEFICMIVDQTDRIAQRQALIATAEVVDASSTVAVRWQTKPGWPVIYASDNVSRWGYPVRAFACGYVHLVDLVHPLDREQLEAVFTRAIAEKQARFTLICRFRWADDSVHWVEIEASAPASFDAPDPCYQGLIRDVTEREQAQTALREQLRFQELITEVSSLFARSLREDLDGILNEALVRIGRFFEVDRCHVHQGRADDPLFALTHDWWGDADQDGRERRDPAGLANCKEQLVAEQCLRVPDSTKPPAGTQALCSELTRQGIRSRLILPLNSEGRLIGALGLDAFVKARTWTDEEIRLLRVLGETIASMLVRRSIEHARQASETRYQQVSAIMSDVAYSYLASPGEHPRIDWITDSVAALTGHTREEVLAQGCWRSLVVNEDQAVFAAQVLGLALGETATCELRLRHRDGFPRWVRSTAECVRDPETSGATRLYGGLVDITGHKARESELQRLALLVEQSPSIVVMTDPNGIIEYVNARFCEVTGFTREDVRGQPGHRLKANAMSARSWWDLWRNIQNGETWRGELQSRKKSGESFWEQAMITPLRDGHGVISHFVKLGEDVSDKKALTERLDYLNHYDPFTGLPNRALLCERCNQAMAHARHEKHGLALLSIDLDKLALINDSLGHAAGDQLLREVAQRLQSTLGKEDTLARFGGDNFALLVGTLRQVHDVVELAEQIRAQLDRPIMLGSDTARVSASIGIALYPEDARTTEELIRHADAALHKAQREGQRLYRFYTPALNEQLLEQFQLEQALRHGLENDELLLFYQPRVDIRTGRILSLEALVRWRHPQWGLVEPWRFIPIAESTGLILDLGSVVLRQACEQLNSWQSRGVPIVPVAVNLSAKELYQEALSEQIQGIMTGAGIDPCQLEFEITESATMHSIDQAIDILSALRRLGLSLSIDDFGTGYASLSYLSRLPMQTIKIDRSFLVEIGARMAGELQGAAILKAIIGLGLNLGLHIIAEGVETQPQRDFLIDHGCNVAQGYLFSRPLPPEQIEPLLRSGAVSVTLH